MSTIQQQIQQLVANGKTKDALSKLSEFVATQDDNELKNLVLSLQGRQSQLEREIRSGVISTSDANLERNKINHAVINITINITVSPTPTLETPVQQTETVEKETETSGEKIILFLASTPDNKAKLQLDKEFSQIATKIQDRNNFDIKSKWAVTAETFLDAVEDYRPFVLHFSGHGTNKQSGQGGIFLEDEDGNSNLIETETLEDYFTMLSEHGIHIEIVVFNSCYSEEQAKAIKPFVKHVIGMNTAIDDVTAIRFASSFYKNYTKHQNIKLAFDKTMMLLKMEKQYGKDVPVLISN